tara:strand:- start:87 stop:389 length:303 start_codon:yes stop_codon:yes gene_type:complete
MEQQHPLYSIDRDLLDGLLAKVNPSDQDFVDLARLFVRYEEFPGAFDIQEDMNKILKSWGISRENLNKRSREIWESGYRPGQKFDETVGSGFDANGVDGI